MWALALSWWSSRPLVPLFGRFRELVSWCFEPSQPQRMTSGLKINISLSPDYSFHKSLNHKPLFLKPHLSVKYMFWNLFIFRGHLTRKPAPVVSNDDTQDNHPILRQEVEASVQGLKKGKSAGLGVDNIPAELVQASGEDIIIALTTICNKICQTGEWPTPWTQSLVIALPKKAICSSVRTTKLSASPATQAKSCCRSH